VFSSSDGLPVAGVSEAVQTRDGYLWLATFDGLVRFDGVRFETFDSERVPALGSNRIIDLAEDRDGSLWVLSEQGHLARYHDGAFSGCPAPQAGRAACGLRQAGAALFTVLTADPAGGLWTGGPSGLFQIAAGELRQAAGLQPAAPIKSLFWDHGGRIWVGTWRGLWMGQPGRFAPVALPPGSFDSNYPSVAEDGEGGIWIAASLGAGRLRGGVWAPEVTGDGFVVRGPDGGIWISLQEKTGNRLLRYRSGRLETVLTGPVGDHRLLPGRSLCLGPGGEVWAAWTQTLYRDGAPVLRMPPDQIGFTSLLVDREGTLWATTSLSGEIHALMPSRVSAFGTLEGLPSAGVTPVFADRDGTIWTGGRNFLAALAPDAARFRVAAGPAGALQTVQAILRDHAGTLWVGTSRGLFSYSGAGIAAVASSPVPVDLADLRTPVVRALYEDRRGALWVGTETGLFRRAPPSEAGPPNNRWTHWTAREGLPHPVVRVIRETPDGTLWLGTNGGGLIRFANGRFTAVTSARGLSSDLVRAIWPAPGGKLWIATENRGINRLDPAAVDRPQGPKIDVLSERQGLYANGVHQMVADDLGTVWMSSNRGLFRARLRDLDAVADGSLPRLETVAYTERDGMRSREANGGVQDSGLRDPAGRIWFPTQGGLVSIDPRQALHPREAPPVHVEGLRVGGDETPLPAGPGGAVRLEPSQRSFALEFTAPSFRAPERQRFRYRLVPYDRGWIEAGTRREAVYTKVPPGHYTFEVLASGPDGAWSQQPAAVTLDVVPRFYERSWFEIACLLAALAMAGTTVAWVVRMRSARLQARQRDLERLVDERTQTIGRQANRLRELDYLKSQFFANVSHELRTPLTLMLGPLQDSLAGEFGPLGGDLAGQLELAERNAQRLLGMVDQLLDIAKVDAGRLRLAPRRGDLRELVRRCVESFLPLAERRGIDLALEAPGTPVEVWFDEEQLEKVFGNLLANALKFTPTGGTVRVAIQARPEADRVEVTVQDNGPGIPADQLERVFERFHQVAQQAPPTGRQAPGAGIGLALARQLVELHQGSIVARNVEDSGKSRGARFTVTLLRGVGHFPADLLADLATDGEPTAPGRPFTPPLALELAASPRDPGTGPEDDRTTVLVVDDNAEIRAYVRRHLEPTYRVLEAADGTTGLDRARRLQPDLVISDVMMPGLDGNALFRALREDAEMELIPVILLTAKASAESRLEGLRDGVDDYLVKPFDPRELRARVDNLIAARKRLEAHFEGDPPRPLHVSEVDVTPADEAFLSRVQATIEARLGDTELTVESLAAALACDRSYLLRKLRALTGETPSDLIRSFRLQRAEQLLRAGAGAVSEIAYSVGFKSVSHFSNAFQDRYGERPSAFAARHRR